MSWEMQIVKWESEPYLIFGESLAELVDKFPPPDEISQLHIYQIGNPNY